MTQVAIERVERRYGPLRVLHDVSLEVGEGEFAVLFGPSGCGKSTLLASIAGLDPLGGAHPVRRRGRDRARPGAAQRRHGVPELRALPVDAGPREPVLRARDPAPAPRRGGAAGGLGGRPAADRRPARPPAIGAVGRAAPARRHQPGAGARHHPVPVRRAAIEPRRQAEDRDAGRDQGAAPAAGRDLHLRHPRTGRGDEARHPHRRHERRPGRAIRPPEDVYERPASTFIAGFIGARPMNLIPARVEGGAALVGGARLPLPPGLAARAPREALLGVRPEALALGPADAGTGMLGRVLVTEPLGSDTLVWVEVDGHRIAARTTPRGAKGLPATVSLTPQADALSLFEATTGLRVEAEGGR